MREDITIYERYRVGQERLAARDPLAAARVLEPAVEEEETSAALWLLLAQAYFASAQLRPAQAAFERVVELDPTDHHARFALGRTFERQSRHQEALANYRVALAMSPDADYEAALRRVEARVAAPAGQEGLGAVDGPASTTTRGARGVKQKEPDRHAVGGRSAVGDTTTALRSAAARQQHSTEPGEGR